MPLLFAAMPPPLRRRCHFDAAADAFTPRHAAMLLMLMRHDAADTPCRCRYAIYAIMLA